jgi:hypothetical protein
MVLFSYGGLGDQALCFCSSGDIGFRCRITVLSTVSMSRRMMVSEALAS